MAKLDAQVAKLVASPLATAALLIQIQTSLKNHQWPTLAKGGLTHSSPPKKYTKQISSRANGEQKGKEVLSRETHNQDIPEDSSFYRPHQLSDVRQVQYLVLRQNVA